MADKKKKTIKTSEENTIDEQNDKKDKKGNKDKKRANPFNMLRSVIALIVVVLVVVILIDVIKKDSKKEIITESSLKEIINVSELSTFEAVYNGVAKVMNEKKPTKVDYYVSYEATVKAGIDFEKVEIKVDNDAKKITVTLPEIKITDTNVDIASLDYIFENKKANTETVSEEAYKACIEDVSIESSSEDAIYELAEQNAKNIIEALISPFVEQLDSEYVLEIN